MFLHVSVILFTGGSLENPPGPGRHPPGTRQTPPWQGEPPQTRENPPGPRRIPPARTPPGPGRHPPQTRENPPGPRRTPRPGRTPPGPRRTPPGRRLQHTVNERPVRILLECILVFTESTVYRSLSITERGKVLALCKLSCRNICSNINVFMTF